MGFTHLHVHSEYSMLDGLANVKELVNTAKEFGMSNLAITDHGNLFGAVDFYKAGIEAGVKPIIGCEVYIARKTKFDRDKDLDKLETLRHLILLVKDEKGYNNLSQIVSKANLEGSYRNKPRTDMDDLRTHSEGLIALSACITGGIPKCLLADDYEGAKILALEFLDIYGEGNFYLEIQDQGLDEERKIRSDLIRLSEDTGIPLVATNDIHYVKREDAKAHDILLCVQTGKKIHEDRYRFTGDQFYMRSEEEMKELFKDIPEALEYTEVIAAKCNYRFLLKSKNEIPPDYFPVFPLPDGENNVEKLRSLCEEGLVFRYGTDKEMHRERLEYELSVISRMGFIDYFLIVWDYIRYARENDISVGPGRGSAAGSIVSYVLRITDLDPIKHGLIFERFLNPERKSMPDIDIDFCIDRRGEVIDYVRQKYGNDNVAQIITFNTLQAKLVIRDVGRVFETGDERPGDDLVKFLPAKAKNLAEAYEGQTLDAEKNVIKFTEESERFRSVIEANETYKEIMKYAFALEGKPRQPSTHAAGVVISGRPLAESIPLYLAKVSQEEVDSIVNDKGDSKTKVTSVQYTKKTVEDLGFLKMDFLGLRNLTMIANAIDLIAQNRGVTIDFSELGYDDPKVYDFISSGQTDGVFQLESTGMQGFMRQLKPRYFDDIIVGISMYRPGPMKDIPEYLKNRRNPKEIHYAHPLLKPILEETYGVMVYQEQVMRIIQDLAGQSLGESDTVRKIMGDKDVDAMMEKRGMFIKGCAGNDISESIANQIFDKMFSFASYAFNKSHAAVYAVIAYQTAYLKTYYKEEFMAALMSSVSGFPDKIARYIQSARGMGIKILPPDILVAQKDYSVSGDTIVIGLKNVKNVGDSGGAIDTIISAREKGLIKDMYSFVSNTNEKALNKRAVLSLIDAGAFDSICTNRARMRQEYLVYSETSKTRMTVHPDQVSFFGDIEAVVPEMNLPLPQDDPQEERMRNEKEVLGVYLSSHPLDNVKWIVDRIGAADTYQIKHPEEFGKEDADRQVILVGLMRNVRFTKIKRGKNAGRTMAFFKLEDYYGEIDVVVFSDAYEKNKEMLGNPPWKKEEEREDETASDSGSKAEDETEIESDVEIEPEYHIVVVRGKSMRESDRETSIRASKISPIEKIEDFFKKVDAEEKTDG